MVKKAILTVENCSALSFLMNTVLEKDFSVVSVPDYGQAISHLQQDLDKEVIIMDIENTDSDNFALLEHISSSSVLNKIRTVVISNSDDESLRNKTVELGASLFLTKPFDPVYLSDSVKNMTRSEGKEVKRNRFSFNMNIF